MKSVAQGRADSPLTDGSSGAHIVGRAVPAGFGLRQSSAALVELSAPTPPGSLTPPAISVTAGAVSVPTETIPVATETIRVATEIVPVATEIVPVVTEAVKVATDAAKVATDAVKVATETVSRVKKVSFLPYFPRGFVTKSIATVWQLDNYAWNWEKS